MKVKVTGTKSKYLDVTFEGLDASQALRLVEEVVDCGGIATMEKEDADGSEED